VDQRNIVATIGRVTAVSALTVLGCMGILRDVGSTPTAATPRPRARPEPDGWQSHAGRRARQVIAELHRDPNQPELHLRLARCLYLGVAAQALGAYQNAFPTAFADGSPCEAEYEAWRRGWFARDRDGNIRRALEHARRASGPEAPSLVRLSALQLMATMLRESGRDSAALPLLLTARRVAPHDGPTRVMLQELRRRMRGAKRSPGRYPAFRTPGTGRVPGPPPRQPAIPTI
jgi:hypothetical protein